MNKVEGHIARIETSGSMSVVSVRISAELEMKAIVIETPGTAPYLAAGNPVSMLFKETEVIIGTGHIFNISLQNRIPGTIRDIEKGQLLSRVVLDTAAGEIISVISTNAVSELDLHESAEAVALIKLNEVMLSEK